MKNKYLILSRNTKANAPNYTEFYEKNNESAKDKWRETIRNQNTDVAILFKVDDITKTLTVLESAEKILKGKLKNNQKTIAGLKNLLFYLISPLNFCLI